MKVIRFKGTNMDGKPINLLINPARIAYIEEVEGNIGIHFEQGLEYRVNKMDFESLSNEIVEA